MYKFLLCLRYLRTRYIALASIVSVMLGVATMIVVNSVMAGFSTEMRDRIHGILADVVLETRSVDGIPDADEQLARIHQVAGDYIEAMTPTVEVFGLMGFQFAGGYYSVPITLIGIDPRGKAEVGPLVEYLDSYNPLRQGDSVVRPPLRTTNDPPDWELTTEAVEYRRDMKERTHRYLHGEGFLHDRNPALPAHGEPEAHIETDSIADAEDLPDFDDPFDVFDQSTNESFDEISFDLEPARLYVGHGLISYPITDPETGDTVTRLMVQPGDDVVINTITAGRPPDVIKFPATIVDTFRSGMSEYDSNLVFMNLEELQKNRGMIVEGTASITSVQIKLRDYADAPLVVRHLEAAFPRGMIHVSTWEDKQGPLLEAVDVETAILNVLLFLIIAVAGFGILAIFFMIVVEKTRDLGILKAMGAGSGGVMTIFLSYGLALGVVGSGVGVVIGLLFVKYINQIEDCLSWITGNKVFDEKIYYFSEIPTNVSPIMVVWVATGAITIAVLASVLPARRAARLHPVEALRYE